MSEHIPTNHEIWSGRKSDRQLYLHEKVNCLAFNQNTFAPNNTIIALLGYACDEGVNRNQGRVGAIHGPHAIRKALAAMPNHLQEKTILLDIGTVACDDENMEDAQNALATKVTELLRQNAFPILFGGGHDIAYGHYNGIKEFLGSNRTIGIINFDAHFDLRSNENGNTSGTPFYQIAQDCVQNDTTFKYLCLGIRKDANDKILFQAADDLGVCFIENEQFSMANAEHVVRIVLDFIQEVDHLYVTIDLDGFSSAYAQGVSAASPMGFSPPIVLQTLQMILDSKKLISLDIAEMNPKYDVANQTAKLAASLIHFVMHQMD